MDELKQVFLQESSEQLDALESLLLELENQPDDATTLNGIFRAAHTIKGAAGMVECAAVESFAHVVENVLDRLRNHEIEVSTTLAALMLRCTDHLRVLVANEAGAAPMSDDEITAQGAVLLEQLAGYSPGGPVSTQPAGGSPGVERIAPGSSTHNCWHISVRFGPDVLRQGMDPENFLRFLETVGDIRHLETLADAMPAAAEMDPEVCYLGFEIALESSADKQAIEDIFAFVRDECRLAILPPDSKVADYLDLIRNLPEDTLRLGEILVQVGALTADELADGLRAQSAPADQAEPEPRPIGEILITQQVVQPELVVAAVAKQAQVTEKKAQDAKLIRVPADKLDHLINLVGELVIAGAATSLLAHTRRDGELIESSSLLTRLVEEIRDASLQLRTVQIGETFNRFHRLVRDACKDLGKDVQLVINGGETELDKSIVEKIGDPLMHLVRNSLDHGIEAPAVREAAGKPAQGTLFLNAFHDAGNIVIEVGDDGAGLNRDRILAKAVERGLVDAEAHLSDREVFDLIFAPGLSTAEQVTNLSGRGVGMDVVRRNLQALRGTINVDSQPGQGTRLTLRLPLTLAIIDGFLVVSGNRSYVIPLDAVVECIERPESEHERNYFNLRGQVLPAVCLREIFSLPGERPARESVVVVQYAGQRAGIVVDRLAGELQAVIKPLGAIFRHLQGIGGSTILGSGEVALILDISALIKLSGQAEQRLLARPEQRSA
ncbi:MAG: chemotaxis protein CheA [Zoogloea sp.]|jgi:two-component system chemotaxis sensor kinase CheA|uniref:chemotaxis protein CheA n=1 Tax=Zoogloea sp. TaxID=49181 RepID=UPI002609FA5D|nr:chemotaxis protein CheA [Zoogloea sp.]MDD3328243.1 chemotaxis protein CheA [Zoogloea sp.]